MFSVGGGEMQTIDAMFLCAAVMLSAVATLTVVELISDAALWLVRKFPALDDKEEI